MTFRLFTDDTPWEQARKDVRHTAASVAAEEAHEALAKPLRTLLVQWATIDQERRDADDAMVDANARVRRLDTKLDDAVEKLASRLLFEVHQDRKHATFLKFFPEPPSEVVRLGLESEIERTKAFDDVAQNIGASKPILVILATLEALRQHGTAALQGRVEVAKRQGRVVLRTSEWKAAANTARRSIENALDAYAIEAKLARDYSDDFFPIGRKSKKKKNREADASPPVE